jgi:hypothetical protein
MYTSQDRTLTRLRGAQWMAKARHGLRIPPALPRESYLGVYALVGVLGGITAALVWLMLAPSPWH